MAIAVGQDVVRRCEDEVEIDSRVAQGAEGFEAGHDHRLASRAVVPKTGASSDDGWQDGRVDGQLVLCDLDGVVWLAHRPIPGSVEAIAELRASGWRVMFVTNNSSSPVSAVEESLASIGVPAVGDVVTSAAAGASLVSPGERVLVCGGPGIHEEIERRRAEIVSHLDAERAPDAVDTVIVGFHREFDFEVMRRAATAGR
ncbi:MAG: hypothetical protein EBS22_09290 [Acidimicrobiia bacterium]|nr:hypothetical protein [Acidimicrobiia bacterium]